MTAVEKRSPWIPLVPTTAASLFPPLCARRRFGCSTITFTGLIGAFALSVAIMISTWVLKFATLVVFANAGNGNPGYGGGSGVPAPGPDGKYTLWSEGIRAKFIPYGASISNLFVNDTNGIERDIVLGFDNATYYSIDTSHPHLGSVPGRYANRIKNR
jgi:hypothetical protein